MRSLLAEVVYFADRSDISEELTRLDPGNPVKWRSLYGYRRGDTMIPTERVAPLCKALKISADWLLGRVCRG